MRGARISIIVAAVVVAPVASAAPPDAEPGLWERTVTRQIEGAPVAPAADRSKLTPEQRARVEQMMSARAATAPTTSVVRYCVTPEAARQWDAFAREDADDAKCERAVQEDSARSLRASLACGTRQKATIAFTAVDPGRVRGTITWVRQDEGGTRTTTIDVDSRWLSSDCGAVKPGAPQHVKG